jgi:four helix bundle protein
MRGKFDFERLTVFQKSIEVFRLLQKIELETTSDFKFAKTQLLRASLSISLNIAEGTGRHTSKDKRNFLSIARGSAFECAAVLLALENEIRIPKSSVEEVYDLIVEISKMLSTLIRNLGSKDNLNPKP